MTYSTKEKQREYYKKYYQLNKEEIGEKRAEHYQLNKEKKAEYYQLNNEKIREERRKQHKEKRAKCVEYLGGKCVVCGTIHNLQFDHIKRDTKKYSITRKLTIKFDNLKEELDKCQLLCVDCHLEKTAKEWADITHKTVPVFKVSITY